MQLLFIKYKIKQGHLSKVISWAEYLHKHKEDVIQTLSEEGVIFEYAAIDHQSNGAYLIYVIRAKNLDQAFQIFKKSSKPIDLFFKNEMSVNLESPEKLQTIISFEDFK